MNDKATINDFLDLLRVETNDAIDALDRQAQVIQRQASVNGRFGSGSMVKALLDAADATCKARIDAALLTMSQATSWAGLDREEVRTMGLQHLQELPERCKNAVNLSGDTSNPAVLASLEQWVAALGEHLRFKARQYAIGWVGDMKETQARTASGFPLQSMADAVEPIASIAMETPTNELPSSAGMLSSQADSTPKTAFVSYSWDDEGHKVWVRELAERLGANGVHVHLDQWDVTYGDSLTQFMEESLPAADFVLVICTPTYASKSTHKLGGVGYEAQIISAHVAAEMSRNKFVPIVRRGGLKPTDADCAVPPHVQGIMAIDMRSELSFEGLLRHIYGQPLLQRPALGAPPSFTTVNSAVVTTLPIRLANYEVEGWELQSGVARNELHPETFQIPDEASRRDVTAGDLVKLMFEYVYDDDEFADEMPRGGERMWVEVKGFSGPYLGSGLIDQSPKMMVAAMQMADMNVWEHRS